MGFLTRLVWGVNRTGSTADRVVFGGRRRRRTKARSRRRRRR